MNVEDVDVMGTEFLEGCLKRKYHCFLIVPNEVNFLNGSRIESFVVDGILRETL